MSILSIGGISLKGIASAVPKQVRKIEDDKEFFDETEIKKITASTGVLRRHVVLPGVCTSDLCFAASEKLIEDAGWSKDSIDILIFISQSPDYLLPATSCSLHSRLNLSKKCIAFDVNMGCSGYIYGIMLASSILSSGEGERALLLVGDTSTRMVSPNDRTTALLFGDAGTATILAKEKTASKFVFEFGTDGTGVENLIVPAGMFRKPHSTETSVRKECENGNFRSEEDLYMNGAEIFAFALREVPGMIKKVIDKSGWNLSEIDACVMHQANKFIIEHLAKKLKLPPEKVVLTIGEYGNTGSSSIPLSMTHALANRLTNGEMKLVLAGFGVGYSWGALALTAANLIMPELIII